eukprot:comp59076_c0_seq1/m.47834 comp59076_c0_seq1/g.47834  ORF comp59076_c0_seq1/g.47834 comp59076_c0_seq1/m.47834 type:complete len:110 (-) comp59076_c0_seq1:331-660(-)
MGNETSTDRAASRRGSNVRGGRRLSNHIKDSHVTTIPPGQFGAEIHIPSDHKRVYACVSTAIATDMFAIKSTAGEGTRQVADAGAGNHNRQMHTEYQMQRRAVGVVYGS